MKSPRILMFGGSVVMLLGLAYLPLAAQDTSGTILGSVTDTSGAAVPDAMVKATNTATGINQSASTDAEGRYRVAQLPIGPYDIQVEKGGFKTAVRKGVVLTVGGQLVIDFAMTVGELSQSVTIEGEVAQVETTTSTISNLVSQSQIRDLPLNGRNYEQLILLAPGANSVVATSHTVYYGNSNSFSVSGGRPNGQAILLDNQDMQNAWNRGGGSAVLGSSMGVDAIAEFQTLINTYGAQFGGSGAVVNSASRSGTNMLHGSGYEFIRNDVFDARNFFATTKPPFRKNQFGGTLGGPIKKDKMFFFVNYEGIKQALGEAEVATVLDAQARTGLLPNSSGVYVPVGAGANNGIPTQMLPVLSFYSAHIPLPTTLNLKNGLPSGTGNVVIQGTQVGSENYGLGRFDWSLSEKDSLFVRYLADQAFLTDPLAASSAPGWSYRGTNFNWFGSTEERHIFSANLINTARFSFSRPAQTAGTPESYAPFAILAGLPDTRMTVNGLGVPGNPVLGPRQDNPVQYLQNKIAEADDLIWTRGSHTMRFGGAVTRLQEIGELGNPGGGQWTFTSIPNFLLGVASQYSGPVPTTKLSDGSVISGENPRRYFRTTAYNIYFQDDWKIASNLTVNFGLRYEPTSNPSELRGNLSAVLPVPLYSIGQPQATAFTRIPNVNTNNNSLHNFDPRIGVAWDPFKDHKTSIRAGYGIFRTLLGLRDWAGGSFTLAPPWQQVTALNASFPNPASGNATQSQTLGWDPNNCCTPYVQQWNLFIQRELPLNTLLTVGYVGSHGVHLIGYYDMNSQIPTANPAYYNGLQWATLNANGGLVYNPRINPNFAAINAMSTDATSKYKALQININKKLSHNLTAQVSYTYSACTDVASGSSQIDNNYGYQNPFNSKGDLGYCTFQIRDNFIANGAYLLPFHGNRLVEGWQISAIGSVYDGLPLSSLFTGVNSATFGLNNDRPNLVPDAPGCNGNIYNSNPKQGNGVFWINTACFQVPQIGSLGNAQRGLVIGPNFRSLDISFQKMTKINERLSAQFRAEFFNILNRANFNLPSGSLFAAPSSWNPSLLNNGAGVSATAGKITSTAGDPREMQFALKLIF